MNEDFNFIDFISFMSFYLGYKNLIENEQQSAQTIKILKQNDVSAANDKQAEKILDAIYRKFDEQNEMLKQIISRLG